MINKKLLNPIQNKGATKTGTSAEAHDTLLNTAFTTVAPRYNGFLRFSTNTSGEIPRINNGIIDSDLFLKEKDLTHQHRYVETRFRTPASGGNLASGANREAYEFMVQSYKPTPSLSIGSKNPLTVDTLLNTLEVFGIVFLKNIER